MPPIEFELRAGFPDGLDRANQTSTLTTNDGQWDRQVRYLFWEYLLRVGEA
jgi:hypothetical protein